MSSAEITRLDATAQADLVRKREISARELVEASIEAIEVLNPALNAVIRPMFEEALAEASEPRQEAPFAGVPLLLKDLVAEYAGVPMSEGSAFLGTSLVPEQDSTLVSRYANAGFIIVGKTNTPEFGLMPTTEPRLFGPTRNPWDTARTPGGSSGGSAAAVAAGMTAAAHANDAGGSIRIPASCCGVFGLKPTRGRNPLGPHYGDVASGVACEHVVTRSVRDSAAILDATAGPEVGEPYGLPLPPTPFAAAIQEPPPKLRIALARTVPDVDLHPDCVAAVDAAGALCQELGHIVEEASPALDHALLASRFARLWISFVGWTLHYWAVRLGREATEHDVEPMTWRMYQISQKLNPGDYLMAIQDLQLQSRILGAFLQDYDVWLSPTLGAPPYELGALDWTLETKDVSRERQNAYAVFTRLANISGLPAMSLPFAWNDQGLPIGVHALGRYGDEAMLLRLAAQIEAAQPWAHRWPDAG